MIDPKKVFVTGADGMLGSSICRELIIQGYTVKAMCLPNNKASTLDGLAIEKVSGDVADKAFLLKEMKNCNYVIHVAALTHVWPRKISKVITVNYEGTKNVMEVAEELKIERMIHIGTASSFNHGSKLNPGDETNIFEGWKYGMDYISSKFKAQEMLLEQFSKNGFPVVIINPTFMIGPFDSGPSSGRMVLAIFKDSLKWYSSGGKNFVFSLDVAKASVNALYLGETGQCYIAGNENLEYKEFFMKTCKLMKKQFNMKKAPNSLLLTIGFMSSLLARVSGNPPKISYGMALLAKEDQYFSPEKARRVLKMPQTSIEVGIEQCMDWFKANKYV
ncbi:MAG: NAD-dependent epimerase/dehydratase family protein [Bacteroidia bacterium]